MKPAAYTRAQELPATLARRIVILDGAMGTMIQRFRLNEAQYRGERFRDFHRDVKGNNELLSLTRPDIISGIHEGYLAAGADIVETNTFGATRVAQADYDMADLAREMNLVSAQLARAACDRFSTPDHPRYVAGALGPTPKTASISPDVNDPGARNTSFEELRASYYEQVEALVEGGSDLLLVETIFDTLNAKAALFAIDEFFAASGERLPLIVSGTVTDASGRILSGQTVTAFWHSVRHAEPLAIGLNCALGAALMRPYIQELNRAAPDTFISCYPNAGLPNPMSETGFDETPDVTSRLLHEFAAEGLVNIVGGCCGTTPEHIGAIAGAVAPLATRELARNRFYPGSRLTVLGRVHARRLREIYRSAGWPNQDGVEIDLLAEGLVERVRAETGHEVLRVTDAGIRVLAETLGKNRAARSAHEDLVERVAREMQRAGRIAWRGLALRARVPVAGDTGGGVQDAGAAAPFETDAETDARAHPGTRIEVHPGKKAGAAPPARWCIAMPDVFSIRNTTVEAYALPIVHEVKVRRADLLGDLKNPAKRAAYLDLASECWYVLGCDARGRPIADASEVPPECGVLVLEAGRFAVVRNAPRRAMSLPFGVWLALAKATPVAPPDEDAQALLGASPG